MAGKTYNVLFLCTGNPARSIMAETLMNAMGKGRFKAFSAGSHATGKVHSLALGLIAKNRLPTAGLRSKNWEEFSVLGAPQMQFVFTACDQAYLFHYYRTGEKRDPLSFWRENTPLILPKPIPEFTPVKRVFRLDGVVL